MTVSSQMQPYYGCIYNSKLFHFTADLQAAGPGCCGLAGEPVPGVGEGEGEGEG